MSTKNYVSLSKLSTFLDNLKNLFATKNEIDGKANLNHLHSWNDLKDKPFGDDSQVFLEWNGDVTGLESIGGGAVIKVSDNPLSRDELIGSIMTVRQVSSGEEVTVTIETSMVSTQMDGIWHTVDNSIQSLEDDVTVNGMTLTRGLWVQSPAIVDMYPSKIAKPGELKTLDPKFIPDLITIEDIDTICGATIQTATASEVLF